MRAVLVFVNYKLWSVNRCIMVPPKHTRSFCRVVPSPAPGSSSYEPRKCQQEKQSQLCSPGRAPWDASQAFFSLLDTCLSNFGEWYLLNHLTAWAEKGHFHILTKRIICWPWLGLKALTYLDSGIWARVGVLLYDLPCRCWIPWTVLKIPCREAANPWTGQQTGMGLWRCWG